jgi:hypothetical protein
MARGTWVHPEKRSAEERDPRSELRERFQERMAHGRYDDLFAASLRMVLREGAAVRGVDIELGAIRFTIAKLLAEEPDAGKLAVSIARLTTAAVQLIKLGQTLGDAADASLAALLEEILIELDEEDES